MKNKPKRDPDGGGDGDGGGSSPSSSSSSDSDSSADTVRRLSHNLQKSKYKVADEVRMGQMPTAAQYRGWRNVAYENINAASGRPDDKALIWALRADDLEGVPDEELRKSPKRFAILDRRISASLQKIAQGELGRQITQAAEDALKENRSIKGLEILRIMIRYFQTNRTADAVYTLKDLQLVQVKNKNIEGFQNSWNIGPRRDA